MSVEQMFKDMTYKRCACTTAVLDEEGNPVVDDETGEPKLRYLEKTCPQLTRPNHGSWYYSFEVEPGADGKRRPRAKKGRYRTQEKAATDAKEAWNLAQRGVNVVSTETVETFLRRWIKAKKLELAKTTAHEYERDIDLYLAPHLGAVRLNKLRTDHVQEMINWFEEENERRTKHREKVERLKSACATANGAWRAAPKAEKAEKRALWTAARVEYEAERKQVRRVTGPNTLQSLKATLRSALSDALKQELVAKNYAALATWPKPVPVKPKLWTPQNVARWRRTGQKPYPVMVWTVDQTAEFLDSIRDDRLFSLWHLIIFRGLRRGEATALTWDDIDLKRGIVHVSHQLVSINYEVHEDTPKADSEGDVRLDQETVRLLKLWRKTQRAERKEWEQQGAWVDAGGRIFTQENGEGYHPQQLSDRWERLVDLSGLPPVRLHDGRHAAASIAFASGQDPKVVQAMLRHASRRTTMDIYTNVMPEMEQASAEASVALVALALERVRRAKAKKAKKKGKKPVAA
ncbi:tyrosine-type recombinase/integrase [Kitasatospora sp. MBT63]|uniref:tyrosine-type recombinase/integrase n=1 Tax=Kitasatospora sp. MBT63 TaxID=1444768 RepID=UPI00068E372B|nr:tyrosine-type recombinase/integrase [Kitasatospora sp. MBT63]